MSSWRRLRRWKSTRSAYGTPSNSQITSEGMGSAKLATISRCARARHGVEVLVDDLDDARLEEIHARIVNIGDSSRRKR